MTFTGIDPSNAIIAADLLIKTSGNPTISDWIKGLGKSLGTEMFLRMTGNTEERSEIVQQAQRIKKEFECSCI